MQLRSLYSVCYGGTVSLAVVDARARTSDTTIRLGTVKAIVPRLLGADTISQSR